MRCNQLIAIYKIRTVGILAVALLLNACVNQPSVPQDYFYRLPELHPSVPHQQTLINGLLLVDELQADGVYRERPLLYVDGQRPLEVVQYHYRHWVQTPSQIIQDNLLEYLREANVADKVERYTSGNSPDLLITGRLQKFEQFVQQTGSTAVVAMEIEFRKKTPQGTVKESREYETKVMADGSSIHDSVIAFGNALQQIYDKILADLDTMVFK